MHTIGVTETGRAIEARPDAQWCVALLLAVLALPALAADGPLVGVDVGISRPTNANYRAHAEDGITANPFVGYMWNDYIGAQGQFSVTYQAPDNFPRRGFEKENQITSLLGATVGPRLALPLDEKIELYGTFQTGGFTGMSGRLTHTAPGFSTGAGLNYSVTPQLAVGLFGRWNRVYMAPRPTTLVGLAPEQQGPADAQFATGGISLTYRLRGPETAPLPVPPAPVEAEAPPEPPAKRAIVLRAVHFDHAKADLRADAAPILAEAAEMLRADGTVAVIVAGHSDSAGSAGYNLALSKRRAEAVRTYLIDHGVAASRIKTDGYGASKPVASNDTAEGRAQNRRVELHVE